MTIKIVCGKCGYKLFEITSSRIQSIKQIISSYDGRCPKCGKILRYDPTRRWIFEESKRVYKKR